ncbi:hypothetical protein G6011_07993 [Alternaria panax]|uniref:Uncharacterized protein n=1 Tax=Alternaria panax TaxID=48097 RepID=A0AAD4FDE6_9PLEO|nr:hypothetical protein G6011_07993 [Alternaria panax]
MDEMLSQTGLPAGLSVLCTYELYLYFSVIGVNFQRIPISTSSGTATGPLEMILELDSASFILLRDGMKAWMSSHRINAMQEDDVVSRQEKIVVQNQIDFSTPTGAAIMKKDGKDVVHIITSRENSFETKESISGGKVIRVAVEKAQLTVILTATVVDTYGKNIIPLD